ncbi:MAG TPA: alpha/beta hydrolase [Nevskiaceae bacterium]
MRARGLRFHVLGFGDDAAPTLFVLHGWGDSSASFIPFVHALLARVDEPMRVFAMDHRGFGYSARGSGGYYWFPDYVADLAAVIDGLVPGQRVKLVGHSMGAQIASLYAGLRPARVERLVLMDGLAVADMPPSATPARYARWLDALAQPPRMQSFASFDALAARIRRRQPHLDARQALFLARCWATAEEDGRVTLLADPLHRMDGPLPYHAADFEAVWRCVTAPTLFLLAEASALRGMLPDGDYVRREACFRNHSTQSLRGVGHLMHVEAPERCAEAVARFVTRELIGAR